MSRRCDFKSIARIRGCSSGAKLGAKKRKSVKIARLGGKKESKNMYQYCSFQSE
jgi:hypothetical protein